MERISGEVVGREEELCSIEVFLCETARKPAAFVVSGEPGIGKTILLEAAIVDTRGRFPSVLACRGVDDVGRSLAPPRRLGREFVRKLEIRSRGQFAQRLSALISE
jgi:hypothetical protein